MKNIINKFCYSGLLNKIFNKSNLNKILIIFIVGFTSRIFINYMYNVNVFIDYLNKISVIYYVLMSMFTVLIHEIITHFNINVIPACVFDSCYYTRNLISSLVSYTTVAFNNLKNLIHINSKIFNTLNFKDFSITSIKNLIKNNPFFNDSNKISLSATQENKSGNNHDKYVSTLNSNTLSRNSSSGNSNKSSSSSSNSGRNITSNREDNRRNGEHRVSRRNRHNVTLESERINNQDNKPNQSNEQQDNPANNIIRENTNELWFNIDTIRDSRGQDLPIRTPNPYNSNRYSESNYDYQPDYNNNPDTNVPGTSTDAPVSYNYSPVTVSYSTATVSYTPHTVSYTPYTYNPDSPVPTMPSPPNPYTNLTTPSSSAQTFRTHVSNPVNNQPIETNPNLNKPLPDPTYNQPVSLAYRPIDRPSEYTASNNNSSATSNNNSSATSENNPVTTENVSYSYHNYRHPALINNPRPRQTYPEFGNENWSQIRNQIEGNFTNTMQENLNQEIRKYSSKEVVVPKQGVLGKVKLGFKYLDEKMHNVDRVYVTFKDKSKRKFVWTLWEKKTGNYVSYEDFKNSWDPKTNVWSEIKARTRKDMRMDIENMLDVTLNNRRLGTTTTNMIQPTSSGTTQEARDLVRKNEAFKHKAKHNNTNTESDNITNSTRNNRVSSNDVTGDVQPNRKHRHKHKDSHGHSSRSHDHSSRSHGHSSRSRDHSNQGHSSRSHGHGHSNRNNNSNEVIKNRKRYRNSSEYFTIASHTIYTNRLHKGTEN